MLGIRPVAQDPVRLGAILSSCSLAIFVSTNAVSAALRAMREAGLAWPASLGCLAVGTATRDALLRAGLPAATPMARR